MKINNLNRFAKIAVVITLFGVLDLSANESKQEPVIKTIYSPTYKMGTNFCDVRVKEEAISLAYSFCEEQGYKKSECEIIGSEEVDGKFINEPVPNTYRDKYHGTLNYNYQCGFKVTLKMEHKTVNPYEYLFPHHGTFSFYVNKTRNILGKLSNSDFNFNLGSKIVDQLYEDNIFSFTNSHNLTGQHNLGKICISNEDFRFTGAKLNGIGNENFNFYLKEVLEEDGDRVECEIEDAEGSMYEGVLYINQ